MLRKAFSYVTALAVGLGPLQSHAQPAPPASPPVDVEAPAPKLPGNFAPTASAAPDAAAAGSASAIDGFLPNLFVGQPDVELPVSIPPMRPSLQFSVKPRYSLGHRGTLGLGWRLDLPNIHRQDAGGIDYTGDKFALSSSDGSRELISTGPNAFRLQSDDKLIRVMREANGQFVLTNKDGTRSWFGSSSSAVFRDIQTDRQNAWQLERVEDLQGNQVTIDYNNVGGVPYVSRIRYGSRASTNPVFELSYQYTDDKLSPVSFAFDFPSRNSYLLDTLTVSAFGNTIKYYKFGFDTDSASGSYLLTSVVERGAEGSASRSYALKYQKSQGFRPVEQWAGGPTPTDVYVAGVGRRGDFPMSSLCVPGNFTGHGKTEIACYMFDKYAAGRSRSARRFESLTKQWQVATSDAGKWVTSVWDGGVPVRIDQRGPTHPPDKSVYDWCYTGNFAGSGRTDIACYYALGAEGRAWRVAQSTGGGWTTADWEGGPRPIGAKNLRPQGKPNWVVHPPLKSCVTGDFDGLGKTGIACYQGNGKWEVAFSTGGGWKRADWDNGPTPQGDPYDSCVTGDLAGTGKSGLACYTQSQGKWQVALSTGSGWAMSSWDNGPVPQTSVRVSCVSGSFNGDAKLGIACYTGANGKWIVGHSTGSGWSTSFWDNGPDPAGPLAQHCKAGNYTGDIKTGVACHVPGTNRWIVASSTGSGWSTATWENGPNPTNVGAQCVSGDINGLGKTSIACFSGSPSQLVVWLANDAVPFALARIEFPTGLAIDYSYRWVDPANHKFLPSAQPVLAGMDIDPGASSPKSHFEFQFAEGYYSVAAREFRGFGKSTVKYPPAADGKAKIVQINFHQGATGAPNNDDFAAPIALTKGRPFEVLTTDGSGRRAARVTTTYLTRKNGNSYYVLPSEVYSRQCDDSCYLAIRRSYQYDQYGNGDKIIVARSNRRHSSSISIDRTYLSFGDGAVSVVSSEKVSDSSSGAVFTSSRYYYDQNVSCGPDVVPHSAGRLLRTSTVAIADQKEHTSWTAYDSFGNVVCRRLPEGGVFRSQYDPTGNWLRKMTNPLGFETKIEYFGVDGIDGGGGSFGLQKRFIDANGDAIVSEYDSLGRKVRETVPSESAGWTTWDYSIANGIETVHSTDATGDESYETRDGLGRIRTLASRGPDLRWLESHWKYNAAGNMESRLGPKLRGVSVAAATFDHDFLGRVSKAIDADGGVSLTCFKEDQTVRISATGEITGDASDELGLPGEAFVLQPAVGRVTTCADAFGLNRIASTRFQHDGMGRLIEVARNGRPETSIKYNPLGNIAAVDDKNNGVTNVTYDADGRVVSSKTEGGVSKYYSYDTLGRPIQLDFGSQKGLGSGDIRYTYDNAIAPQGIGRLHQVQMGDYKRTMTYDALGNVSEDTISYGDKDIAIKRQFDFKRRLTKLVALGNTYDYRYDGGILKQIDRNTETILKVEGVSLSGHPTLFTLPQSGTVALKFASPQDGECNGNIARLCKVEARDKDGKLLFVEAYKYDAQGRIKTLEQPGQRTAIFRDVVGRLIKVENASAPNPGGDGGVGMPLRPDEEFRFDSFGRLSWSKEAGDYRYDDAANFAIDGPRQVGGQEVKYRADGRADSIGTRRFEYDGRGLLAAVNDGAASASFKYDPDGGLLEVASSAKKTTFFGDSVICRDAGCQLRLRGLGPILLAADDLDVKAFAADSTGSPRVLVDERARSASSAQTFTVYGLPVNNSAEPQLNGIGFGQNLYDSETSLYLLGARAFDPSRHVFLGPDPKLNLDDRSFTGKYVYGNGDPLTFEDRDGELAWFVPILVGAIIGATAAAVEGRDVLKGATMGAIGGAFYWVGMEYLGGQIAGYALAGAASGATNAALFGGDVGEAALMGGVVGGLSGAFFSTQLAPFGSGDGLRGSLNYTINTALRGAAAGGAYASFTGEDIGRGALRGAVTGATGAAVNMSIGHALGFALSGLEAPEWNNGAWEYNANTGSAFTIGNVVVGDQEVLETPAMSGKRRSLNEHGEEANVRGHELGHIPQSETLGLAYLPAVGLSYLIGGAFGARSGGDFWDRTHSYSFFENESGFNEVPDFH
ncbi:MAG: hypothetical protein EOS47_06830 [Mesorhizobium sp.]|nr:MAG: hypothetical protein EOS47_06830 [Mesorhizobium sp.]